MPKITIIGAGSTVFLRNIVGDILFLEAFENAEFALYDIDSKRLDESMLIAEKLNAKLGTGARFHRFHGTSERRDALAGSDFVICMFQVGGYEPATVIDFEVSKAHGISHTIADTLGAAGIMRALRSVPLFLEICDEMAVLCPDAWLLNYVNPMAMITWAVTALCPKIRYIGLCHSVQGTASELARDLDIDTDTLSYFAAGINHMAFYLRFEQVQKDGSRKDLYPELLRGFQAGRIPKESAWNPRCPNLVRYEMFRHLGYFVTESSEHFAEYSPYFIKSHRPELIETFRIPLDEYPKRCIEQIDRWDKEFRDIEAGMDQEVRPSREYAARILNAIHTGRPDVINGNLANRGLIDNLPSGAAVEVPCLVDSQGIQPVKVGDLPPHLAALISTNVNVQALFTEAFLRQDRRFLYHAAMMDPRSAAELTPGEIAAFMDDLLARHKEQHELYRLPEWV